MSCPAHNLAVSRAFLREEDVDLIQEMVAMLPSSFVRVVDLGAGSGTTALAVLCSRKENIQVITIDISQEALDWSQKAVENAGYLDKWKGICSDSKEDLEINFIDFLLLDTSHEYEDTKQELEVWLPKLKSKALIWLHDYEGEYPGVKRALTRIRKKWIIEEIGVKGLGWGGRLGK